MPSAALIVSLAGSVLALGAIGSAAVAESKSVMLHSKKLWKDTETVSIPATLRSPDGSGPFAAVVLLPNCGGPKTYEFSEFWPEYLNKLGYVALNVDHFTPRGGKLCTKSFKPSSKEVTQDAYGALSYLAGLPAVDANRIAVLGSSLGALAINWFAGLGTKTPGELNFAAAVSLYPSNCEMVKPGPQMIPTSIILGSREEGVSSCERLPKGGDLDITIFPGIYHGFDQPDATVKSNGKLKEDIAGNKRLYDRSATEKAQAIVEAFLRERLAVRAFPADAPGSVEKLGKVNGKDPYKAVEQRDGDSDGRVSRAEWDKSSSVFDKIDADGDGFLTPSEFYAHWSRH